MATIIHNLAIQLQREWNARGENASNPDEKFTLVEIANVIGLMRDDAGAHLSPEEARAKLRRLLEEEGNSDTEISLLNQAIEELTVLK